MEKLSAASPCKEFDCGNIDTREGMELSKATLPPLHKTELNGFVKMCAQVCMFVWRGGGNTKPRNLRVEAERHSMNQVT